MAKKKELPVRFCPQCGEPLKYKKHLKWCENYKPKS